MACYKPTMEIEMEYNEMKYKLHVCYSLVLSISFCFQAS